MKLETTLKLHKRPLTLDAECYVVAPHVDAFTLDALPYAMHCIAMPHGIASTVLYYAGMHGTASALNEH